MTKQPSNALTELALEAQEYPAGSQKRSEILQRLMTQLQQPGQLYRPNCDDEIYQVAVQKLCLYLCEKIDRYDTAKGKFRHFANVLLRLRFIKEAYRDELSLSNHSSWHLERCPTTDLVYIPVESSQSTMAEKLVAYLQEDPNNMFSQKHVRNKPEVNFRIIALMVAAGFPWQDLAKEFNTPVGTLSSFYQRCLTEFRPHLQDYLLS